MPNISTTMPVKIMLTVGHNLCLYRHNLLGIIYATKAVANKAEASTRFEPPRRSWVRTPLKPQNLFLGFLRNRFSCFITTRITFSSILYPQCTYMIDIIFRHYLVTTLAVLHLVATHEPSSQSCAVAKSERF